MSEFGGFAACEKKKLCYNQEEFEMLWEAAMKICGLQKMTLLDYPGKVACTVFLGGCNFRCPFCHNSVYSPLNANGTIIL